MPYFFSLLVAVAAVAGAAPSSKGTMGAVREYPEVTRILDTVLGQGTGAWDRLAEMVRTFESNSRCHAPAPSSTRRQHSG